ncbi:MAG: shikimate dehydrogenase [Eggerthellales bacterium]|nr:shikimate dehydrogenase [Eggerthellales bacterium]
MGEKQRISGHTKTVALIGSPVEHSGSPAIHNLSFEQLGCDAVYVCQEVQPEGCEAVIKGMKQMGGFAGANATMPCKQLVVPLMDELSDSADLIGAVNTIKFENGRAIGHNTDGVGFMEMLRQEGVTIEGSTITLCGPGGAGSAILVQAALDGAAEIFVFARGGGHSYKDAEERIPRIVERTGCKISLHKLEDAEDYRQCVAASQIFINATNVGMGEGNTDTPLPAEFIHEDLVVSDTIYFPLKTQLLLDAEAKGCQAINGKGMLLYQAAAGEKIWFDIDMDVDYIREHVG